MKLERKSEDTKKQITRLRYEEGPSGCVLKGGGLWRAEDRSSFYRKANRRGR